MANYDSNRSNRSNITEVSTCLEVAATDKLPLFFWGSASLFAIWRSWDEWDDDSDKICASPKSTSANLPHTKHTHKLHAAVKVISITDIQHYPLLAGLFPTLTLFRPVCHSGAVVMALDWTWLVIFCRFIN